ncbi:hypothetical protein HII31_05604 [Pseudocercospora fuligena]|uniref:ABM domain-containing protein n=1 Tax=Pseudocercospora fuligena TaxID=685502 RepID=A0A8H6RLH5_9PEZI|nr:hypothetical protein HII31_05604 [Pseudocercospora fuligena]
MSSPEEVHILAILYAKPEKMSRLQELMQAMIKTVHDTEPHTVRYMMTKQIDTEIPAIHMIETYKTKESAEAHTQTEHFKSLFAAFDEENIFAKPPYLAFTKIAGGFDLHHKLI